MAKYCPACGAEYDDDANFCAECSVRLVNYSPDQPDEFLEGEGYEGDLAQPDEYDPDKDPPPPGMPESINYYDGQFFWEGECSALEYGTIFKVPAWIVGSVGGLIALILILCGHTAGGAATIVISLAIWLVLMFYMLLIRNNHFKGHFSIEKEKITVSEETTPPKNVFLLILFCILKVVAFILQLAWILMGMSEYAAILDLGGPINRQVKIKKIKSVDPTQDKRFIYLTKGMGSMKLVVTPEICDFLTEQIRIKMSEAK